MDQIDRILIFELSSNCRASFSMLAEKYGITSEEVSTRVTKLLQQKIIIKFTVVPSAEIFGEDAIILFRSNTPLLPERVTLLGIQSCVEFISMSQDHTEGFAYVHYRSEEELEDLLNHFGQFHRGFTDLRIYRLQRSTSALEARPELKGTHVFEKIDWLLLSHLREQGRLPIEELAKRTKFSPELIADRLFFLREAGLIEETIYINLSKSPKESHTIFFLELDLLTQLLQKELTRELEERFKGSFWKSWKVSDQQIMVLSFLCSSYSEIDKIQSFLSDLAGLKSIESIMGGVTYHFPDFRDEIIEEKRSHGWFSPEQWL
ncbi:MAG: AsnC family transcriptional regulator [Candidatus Hodarchaeales archaeon]